MSQKEANHSSTERTVLWTIVPVAIALSLLFTSLNHHTAPPRPALNGDLSAVRHEKKMPATSPGMHQADTTAHEGAHMDKMHPAEPAPAHGH